MNRREHKVLVFGKKVFGSKKPNISIEYCSTDFISFPDESEKPPCLSNYDLILLDYSAFLVKNKKTAVYEDDQNVFEKEMLNALKRGSSFCIVHFDEEVPYKDGFRDPVGYSREIQLSKNLQIGFRWLQRLGIYPFKDESQIIDATLKRNEFKVYHERWGTSKNYFLKKDGFEDAILSFGEAAQGFSIPYEKGRILYMPCQRDFSRPESISGCLQTLISSIITYLTLSSHEALPFAEEPFFSEEKEAYDRIEDLKAEIEVAKDEIRPYEDAKRLLSMRQYVFEREVPLFLNTHLKFDTMQEEQYEEDFWILNSESEKIVIGETKTHVGGSTRADVYSLYQHREAYGFDETFPALLIVNVHLNAKSLKDKLRSIDPRVYESAERNNILMSRIEDLLYFWNSINEGKNTSEELLSIIQERKGWMKVQKDGNYKIYPIR